MKKNNFDISVRRFNQFAGEFAKRFMDVSGYAGVIDLFCESIPVANPRILELGCGPGNITGSLKSRFPDARITAIDLAPAMIEIARKFLPEVDFKVMDVRNISGLSESFDAVMCSFCLPFLSDSDAQKLIADCYWILNSGGIIYLSTMEGGTDRAGFEPTSFSGNSKIYFNYFRQDFLEKALIDSGFSVLQKIFQDYHEPDGSETTDMIFIAAKL